MFRSTLADLIRGLRANRRNEKKYITGRMDEIRSELRSTDMERKVNAVCKLSYVAGGQLHMLGYDMGWASFHVVEVMASSNFYWKRQGYLAAAQSFTQDTDVLMLTTNLIKKDIASSNPLEVAVAINGLSHIITPDLARDLLPGLLTLTTHSRSTIRKRAVLILYKVCLKQPEALHECFPRLAERLDDADPSVNVIYELARRNPRNYLPLAPQLFRLLTTSSNNWMLIKIIKLFAALTPLEPRLVRKLLPSFRLLIETTPAMSVLYECIQSVISVKYVGLVAFADLVDQYPRLVVQQRDLILACAEDADLSIRVRALELMNGVLIPYFSDAPEITFGPDFLALSSLYRTAVIERIICMCSHNAYAHVVNFEWYIAVLMDLSRVTGVHVGDLLATQLIDVAVRVKSVRAYCVRMMANLLDDQTLLATATQPENNTDILRAAAYIVGEYNE
ncbi:armadillo-type protein [Thamnocephalis sphaerospora]|uniref:Armadillo-type protein n=1 Tax=Thamnocephalis sphaerospora TaxID=78915 RepID=A0A4P9XVW8_9FUNG|nr:armadillo-type protein [Thamnocephalis sphaerospora]|eukprot:RKP10435.1 armadillo-type protein [Thamnocephalis sphaerospora]